MPRTQEEKLISETTSKNAADTDYNKQKMSTLLPTNDLSLPLSDRSLSKGLRRTNSRLSKYFVFLDFFSSCIRIRYV